MVFTAEFLNLCQTQTDLLREHFGATETAIYWTQSLPNQDITPTLIPVVVYPESQFDIEADREQLPLSLSPGNDAMETPPAIAKAISLNNLQDDPEPTYQEVLPLLYQEEMMGLLVVRRLHLPWQGPELNHIKKIGQTLAIASSLEKRLQQAHHLQTIQQQQWGDLLHQLKNPLTAITTFAKLLAKKIVPGDRTYKLVTGIQRESDHLKLLLEKFGGNSLPKTLPFLESQALLPSSSSDFLGSAEQTIELKTLLEEILMSAHAIATEQQISLQWQLPEHISAIKGDREGLYEIVMNILENAIKYTPKNGQVFLGAGIERTIDNQSYQGIAIADTGYGIPLEDQGRIFERSYRGGNTKDNIQGSGLGLAIVRELLHRMEGKIELTSPNGLVDGGGGTTFTVWLRTATD